MSRLNYVDIFGPGVATPPRPPAFGMTADRSVRVRSRGYYPCIKPLPRRCQVAEGLSRFSRGAGEAIMVLPWGWKIKVPVPVPFDVERVDDDSYRQFIFRRTDWHDRVLSGTSLADYLSPLSPADRSRFDNPLQLRIMPAIAQLAHPAATIETAGKYVRLYYFDRCPEVEVIDAAKPDNAIGPYLLQELPKDGRQYFTVFLRSLTRRQRAELDERTVPWRG